MLGHTHGHARVRTGPLAAVTILVTGYERAASWRHAGGVSVAAPPIQPLPAPPPPRPVAPARRAGARERIGGIDAARALAIIGMVMVHIGPHGAAGAAGRVYDLSYGRASMLFVTLAGVGVTLLAGDRSWPRRGRTSLQLLWRIAVFVPLGLWLQTLDHPVAVILQYYAAYYLVGAIALHLPDRALLATAGVWAVVGPLVWLRAAGGDRSVADPGDLGEVVTGLFVDGIYPVLTWAPALLFGMWLGRLDLRSTRVRWVLVAGGTGAALVAYGTSEVLRGLLGQPGDGDGLDRLLLAEGHSGMPLNLLGAVGVATAVLGACLLATSALPRVTWPVVAMGQLAFTIYVGHLFVLVAWPEWLIDRDSVLTASLRVGRFALVCLLLATLWRLVLARGPLEQLLHLPFRRRGERVLAFTGDGAVPVDSRVDSSRVLAGQRPFTS